LEISWETDAFFLWENPRVSIKGDTPIAGWFISWTILFKLDDLGVPRFFSGNLHIAPGSQLKVIVFAGNPGGIGKSSVLLRLQETFFLTHMIYI
jgi:hypothetical protein